jgi:hypothetical protein
MGLMTQVKKGYKDKLIIPSINLNFTSFDANTQCLMRQDVRLLSEKTQARVIYE